MEEGEWGFWEVIEKARGVSEDGMAREAESMARRRTRNVRERSEE